MANYKVNNEAKSIIVSGTLTDIEISIVSAYIGKGYSVKEKRYDNKNKHVKYEDIKAFYNNKDNKDDKDKQAIFTAFKAEMKKKSKNKNGKERENGFLKTMKWFKENHWEDYAVIYKDVTGKDAKKATKAEETK